MAVCFRLKLLLLLFIFSNFCFAQPYVDIVHINAQTVNTSYKDSSKAVNHTKNAFLNLTLPLKIDSQNTIIIRLSGEDLQSSRLDPNIAVNKRAYSLLSVVMPIGLQHQTKNKKWTVLGLVMPKLSSDFKDKISTYDMQLGGYGLVTYAHNPKLKIKLGLYYNREYFGNFFIPLAGVDWRVSDRFQMYGVLPTFYRLEFAAVKKVLYAGLEFRSYTRSYRLSATENHNYVKNAEVKAKLFVDFYIKQKLVLFVDFGRTISYSPQEYLYDTKTKVNTNPIYTKIQDAFLLNFGIAFRIRNDFK